MSEPETAEPTYSGLISVLERLVADVLRLDEEGLELLDFKLLQAREMIAIEQRRRKKDEGHP
jgi:hypothetical protein